jgi:elongation factor 1-beta
VVIFTALGKAPAGKFAHALRWYNHIKSYGDDKKKFTASKKALAGGAPAPAAKAEEDDDVDLFASDEEVCEKYIRLNLYSQHYELY